MTMRIRASCLFLATFFALLGSGAVHAQSATAGAPWSRTVEAAQKEGRVVIYGVAVPPVMERIKADFEKAHPGIAVEYYRYPGAQLIAKVEQGRLAKADEADLLISAEVAWLDEKAREGYFVPASGPSAAAWPANQMIHPTVTALMYEIQVVAYNKNLVKPPITSYSDLLRPELKGKIATQDIISTNIIAQYDWFEKTQEPNFLARLAAQQPKLYTSSTIGIQSVASGEVAAITTAGSGVVVPLIKEGAPIAMYVANPAFGFRYGGAIMAAARRPAAAQVMMDYLLSRRGQTVWAGGGDSASPLPNIPGSLDARAINAYDAKAYPAAVTDPYKVKWNSLFKK